jgi:hypothetical protein
MKVLVLISLLIVITSALKITNVEPEKSKDLIDVLSLDTKDVSFDANDLIREKRQFGNEQVF